MLDTVFIPGQSNLQAIILNVFIRRKFNFFSMA